ncbi:efflux RND transporter periplasmic adaptor subunit [Ruegeria sp.]|uniref:efflux RND transporter periplasmic adaptor subunit n=1 Tax=Ruegeria sp. TaxID=1879320 RepID=UPI002309F71F|nr:efflux RND transporter periplasmic adaptor subunit [Ruegeria sp.]MDA7965598.1 efflux RND transporter periplasmic adaptor subunit [Ruegeria sp.]
MIQISRLKTQFFTILWASVLATGAVAQGWDDDEGDGPANVTVKQVQHLPDTRTHLTIGTALAAQTTALVPESEGIIDTLFVTSGQQVQAGQDVLKLDSAQEELAVQQAKVQLRAAQKIFDRYKALGAKGAVPEAQLETAEIDLDTARIALQEAELALSRRVVTAPFDGRLGMIDLHPGAHITTATEIAQLDDMSTLLVDFFLPESAIGALTVGDAVPIQPMNGAEPLMAQVQVISHRIDPQARTFGVRATIDAPQPWMKPGMSFRVSVVSDGGSYPVVSETAILWGSHGAYLWRVDEGTANRIPLTVVRRRDGQVWVEADLPPGSYIVTEGVQKLRQGDAVALPGSASDAVELTSND